MIATILGYIVQYGPTVIAIASAILAVLSKQQAAQHADNAAFYAERFAKDK